MCENFHQYPKFKQLFSARRVPFDARVANSDIENMQYHLHSMCRPITNKAPCVICEVGSGSEL